MLGAGAVPLGFPTSTAPAWELGAEGEALAGVKAVGLEILQSEPRRLDSLSPQGRADPDSQKYDLIPIFSSRHRSQNAADASARQSLNFIKKTNLFHTDLSVIVDCVPLIGAFGKKSYYPLYILLLVQEYYRGSAPHTHRGSGSSLAPEEACTEKFSSRAGKKKK